MNRKEPLESERQYATTGPRDQPHQYVQTSREATAALKTQDFTGTTFCKPEKSKALLIALAAALIVCLLVVSLVAVILYRPQVRTSSESADSVSAQTSSMEDLLSRIQQLEDQLEAKQTTNQTALQVKFDQLSSFDTSVTSQFISMQNLIQSISSVQNNLRQDLNRLRTVDLYQRCTQNTRTCTMASYGSSYYWRYCNTGSLSANPTVGVILICLHSLNVWLLTSC